MVASLFKTVATIRAAHLLYDIEYTGVVLQRHQFVRLPWPEIDDLAGTGLGLPVVAVGFQPARGDDGDVYVRLVVNVLRQDVPGVGEIVDRPPQIAHVFKRLN